MPTASMELKLHVQQQQPEGGWSCALVAGNRQQLVSLPSEDAVAEFLAEQLERLVNEAMQRVGVQRFHEHSR